jgi:hypothetical protein
MFCVLDDRAAESIITGYWLFITDLMILTVVEEYRYGSTIIRRGNLAGAAAR